MAHHNSASFFIHLTLFDYLFYTFYFDYRQYKLKISVYVDGSGGSDGGFGFFVKETGESFYEKKSEITNNQAEYLAIISALKKFVDTDDEITIFSDSKNTVNQLNHEFYF